MTMNVGNKELLRNPFEKLKIIGLEIMFYSKRKCIGKRKHVKRKFAVGMLWRLRTILRQFKEDHGHARRSIVQEDHGKNPTDHIIEDSYSEPTLFRASQRRSFLDITLLLCY